MTGEGADLGSAAGEAVDVVVTVNGEARRLPHGTTLAELVATLAGGGAGVAVALDREVVPRSTWGNVVIEAGTHLEVVTAAAGG